MRIAINSFIFTVQNRMFSFIKKYSYAFVLLISIGIAACSVDNKAIPDPGGNVIVDTSGNSGVFYLDISGDTAYRMTIIGAASISNDSFIVLGADSTTLDQVLFGTISITPGVYLTEQDPPSTTGALFLFRKKELTIYKNYLMVHGNITISSVDTTSKIVRGSVDVNNTDVSGIDKHYIIQGNFAIKY